MRAIEQAIHHAAGVVAAARTRQLDDYEFSLWELSVALIEALKEVDSRLIDIEKYLEPLRKL